MLTYLFDCRETIPDGVGFSVFSPGHLLWLAATVAGILLACRRYRQLDTRGRSRFRTALAALIVADELLKTLVLAYTGQYTADYLPLHLCSINIFTSLWYTLRPNRAAGSILYYLALPGAAVALLSPSWVKLPFLNLMNFHSFSIHALLLAYPVVLLAAGELRPRPRQLWMPAVFLLAAVPVIYWINVRLDTNFMFINGTDNNPILNAVDAVVGSGNHILGMAVLVFAVWFVMTLPWMARRRETA